MNTSTPDIADPEVKMAAAIVGLQPMCVVTQRYCDAGRRSGIGGWPAMVVAAVGVGSTGTEDGHDSMGRLRVAVAGAGLGGLCLAQGLARAEHAPAGEL
jgi:hypothetical protein